MNENQQFIREANSLDYILSFQNYSPFHSTFSFSNDPDIDTNNDQNPLNPLSIKEPKKNSKKLLEEDFFDKEDHIDIFIDEKI